MLGSGGRRRAQNRWLMGFMALSLVGHSACVATYAWLQGNQPPPVPLNDNIVKARLVKLGPHLTRRPRPPNRLRPRPRPRPPPRSLPRIF
jgi:hypothetical protein